VCITPTAGSTHPRCGFVSPAAPVVGPSGTNACPHQGPEGPTRVATSDRTREAGEGTRGAAPIRAGPGRGRRPRHTLLVRPSRGGRACRTSRRVQLTRVAGSFHPPLRSSVPAGPRHIRAKGPQGPRALPRVTEPAKRVTELVDGRRLARGPARGRRPRLASRPPLAGRVRVSRVTAGSTHPQSGFVSPAATVVGPCGTKARPHQGPAGPTSVATSEPNPRSG
jgi:hypothetical protein